MKRTLLRFTILAVAGYLGLLKMANPEIPLVLAQSILKERTEPLTFDEIKSLMKETTDHALAKLIRGFGIAFELNSDELIILHQLGVGSETLQALEEEDGKQRTKLAVKYDVIILVARFKKPEDEKDRGLDEHIFQNLQ